MGVDVAAILKRSNAMQTARQPNERLWVDCFDYTYPERGDGFYGNSYDAMQIQAKRAQILDSTGTDGARILASAIQAGLTPSNSRWFGLEVEDPTAEEKAWLDKAAEVLWSNIHNSNFDASSFEACLDIVCAGWAALYIDEDREKGGFVFEQWAIGKLRLGSTRTDGKIDIVHRPYNLTAEQAVREFGEAKVSQKTRELARKKPDDLVEFLHAIYPRTPYVVGSVRAVNLPFASCHIEVAAKHCVKESGYHEFPVIVPRWMRLPNSVYATGPVKDALPDIKTLNKLVEFELAAAGLAVTGMWIAEDDGVLNPRNIKVGPGKVIVANSVESMKPLQSGAQFDVAFSIKGNLQAAIRKILMADQLTPADGPQMTATEVHVRVELIRQQLGPMYGRLQSEYLQPIVERCFGIAARAGVFTAPPASLASRNYTVKYVSPMARAQKLEDVSAMDRYELTVMQKVQINPEAADQYDWDKADKHRAELLGVPAYLMRDEKAVKKIRADRQQAQQDAQQQAMAAETMAATAKEVGKNAVAQKQVA